MNRVASLVATFLLAGFLGASLVRLAPGYGVDPDELDPRWNPASIDYFKRNSAGQDSLPLFYARFLANLASGNLGTSQALGQPVTELLRERFPVTLRSVAAGLAIAWTAAFLLVLPSMLFRLPGYDFTVAALAAIPLCLPSAAVALLFLYLEAGPAPALGVVVFPRLFRYVRNLLVDVSTRPHVLAARARGLGRWRILIRHLLAPAAPQLFALLGVSASLALTAAIPIEALCDSPGIGQLAWTGALARDLPLLVILTLLVAAVTLSANTLSEIVASRWTLEKTNP